MHRPLRRIPLAATVVALLAGWSTSATAAPPPQSGPVIELRQRYEHVDDAASARNADAHTLRLRLRLGYHWAFAPGWQAHVDGEHVQPLSGEHYNSTANGRVQYPVVADPKSTELNQAFIAWSNETSGVTVGRQRIQLDNQRFIGNSGWRQNEQTFDAVALKHSLAPGGPTFQYIHLDRVLRVFGEDHPDPLQARWKLNGHLLHLDQPLPLGQLATYGYLIKNRDVATLSTQTWGLRWTGQKELAQATPGWALEYAHQSDWGNNPLSVSASYRLLEGSLKWRGVTFRAGQEVLGGDGRYGFSTPYASLHPFNGWADRFGGVSPRDGLDDRYFGASGGIGASAFTWAAAWHDFRADHGGASYGTELDLSLGYAFGTHWNALLKYADYRADGFSTDVRKAWASVEYRF
ncbi:MAG: alginate export family protein [Xanthomonadales bacterium]|nr:alginate export family protein [Xanthomonadales bacterium]